MSGFFLLIVTILLSYVVANSYIRKNPLFNRKLCNNDPKNRIDRKCFSARYDKEVKCDGRTVANRNCNEIIYTMKDHMLSQLSEFDGDETIRRITIDLTSVKPINLTLLSSNVDQFLLPRPMWTVVHEPFTISDSRTIVMERYNQKWDPYFMYLTFLQFTSADICSKSMMLIGRQDFVHPGYSDGRITYFNELKYSPIPYGMYVDSSSTQPSNSGFISEEDCPLDHENRWTCAFLQTTNCTLPTALHNTTNNYHHLELYHSADTGGTMHHTIREDFVEHMVNKSRPLMAAKKRTKHVIDTLPPFVYSSPFTQSVNLFRFHGPDENQAAEFLFNEFLFRRNYFYRRKVAELLTRFRDKYKLGKSIRTKQRKFVAVHLRRSDRMIEGVNMTDFCQKILIQKFTGIRQNCTYNNGVAIDCYEDGASIGCDNFGDVPVGAVTLDSVVPQAELLVGPSIRNMMVFSEDVEWLEREIVRVGKLFPKWRFYSLDPPANDKRDAMKGNSQFQSRTSGTAAGVFYQATLDLVRECDALLGHFTSAVPMTFAGAMCHHHAGMEGICPPVHNLKNNVVSACVHC